MKPLYIIILLLFLTGCDNSFFVVTLGDIIGLGVLALIILAFIAVFLYVVVAHYVSKIRKHFKRKK